MSKLALVALIALLVGCPAQKKSEPNGVGQWEFGKTVLKDGRSKTRCNANGDVEECMAQGLPVTQLGAQKAATTLIFKGHDDTSPLVEIVLDIRACEVADATAALTTVLGEPDKGSTEKRRFWQKKLMFVHAELPDSGGTCNVRFVEAGDTAYIEDLKKGD